VRIHFAIADWGHEYNTSLFRCMIPADALSKVGHDVSCSHFDFLDELDPTKCNAVIIERNLFDNRIIEFVRRARGKTGLIATFDDFYDIIPDYVPSHRAWQEPNLSLFKRMLSKFDVVIVPSRILVDDYKQYGNVQYMPNYYDAEMYQDLPEKKDDGKVHIVWGGNDTHREGLLHSGVMAALQSVCKFNVVVHACGTPNVTNLFMKFLPKGKVIAERWMPFHKWPAFVSQTADIAIAPLWGEYDKRRSWVKLVDFAMVGVPVVASAEPPYEGTGALLVENTEKAWRDALMPLVKTPRLRERTALPMVRFMADKSIQDNVKEYEDICK